VLEAHFTVCWWEQPGAGLSFDSSAPPGDVTMEALVADTRAVTDHLRARFGPQPALRGAWEGAPDPARRRGGGRAGARRPL